MRHKALLFLLGLMVFLHAAQAQLPPATVSSPARAIADSVRHWKEDGSFQYMSTIDSILRSRSDLRSDTVRMNKRGRLEAASKNSAFNRFLNIPVVKILLMVIAVFFIGFILYKILSASGFLRMQFTKKRPASMESVVTTGAEQYENMAANAENAGNYAEATRYSYLHLLRLLSDKNLIQFSAEKTNQDYMRQLSQTILHEDFARLTRYYEYVWYGEFAISRESWHAAKGMFTRLSDKINARY